MHNTPTTSCSCVHCQKSDKKHFLETEGGTMLGCAVIIVAAAFFVFILGWSSSLNN